MDVDEAPGVHAVDVEDSVQVVHLMLEDPGGPAAGRPAHRLPSLIQPWNTISQSEGILEENQPIRGDPGIQSANQRVSWNTISQSKGILEYNQPITEDPGILLAN